VLGALAAAGVVLAVMLPDGSKHEAQAPVRHRSTVQPKPKPKPKAKSKTTPAATTPATTATTQPATTATTEQTTTQSTPPPAAAAAGPHQLNDQAWALMKQGRYSEALPLLEQAVPALRGAGPSDLAEGYANYNLGYTLLQLGRCDEAKPYLDRAKHLEPDRTEVASALDAVKQCHEAAKAAKKAAH
jgi:tetratricopeptide (TPR) repeat protein